MQDTAAITRAASSRETACLPFPGGAATAILRNMIAAGVARRATIQDQIDAGDAAFAMGETEAGRLLYAMAAIRKGFGGPVVGPWRMVAERAGLRLASADAPPPAGSFGLVVALDELRGLLAVEPAPTRSDSETPADPTAQLYPAGTASTHYRALDAIAVVGQVVALHDALCANDVAALAGIMDRMLTNIVDPPAFDTADYSARPPLEMAAAGVLAQLRDFFRQNHHLCRAPFGSPRLLSACARLAEGGLGPYLSGVGRLIRSTEDLSGLIGLADDGDEAGRADRLQRWLVLLASHLGRDDRLLLAEQMGDGGRYTALDGMFEAVQRGETADEDMLVAIRDAALDGGRMALAARVQTAIIRLSIKDAAQWIVLADILATQGAFDAARTVLDQALIMTPNEPGAVARRAAFRSGEATGFRMIAGVASPPWRVALRARHRLAN